MKPDDGLPGAAQLGLESVHLRLQLWPRGLASLALLADPGLGRRHLVDPARSVHDPLGLNPSNNLGSPLLFAYLVLVTVTVMVGGWLRRRRCGGRGRWWGRGAGGQWWESTIIVQVQAQSVLVLGSQSHWKDQTYIRHGCLDNYQSGWEAAADVGRQTPEKDFPDVPWCVAVVGEQGQDQVIVTTTTIAILTLISSLLILNQLMILNAKVVRLLLNQNAFYFSHLIPKTTQILFIFSQNYPHYKKRIASAAWHLLCLATSHVWSLVLHDTCSLLPDRDRKLYLAVLETNGEFPDIITVLSLSLW